VAPGIVVHYDPRMRKNSITIRDVAAKSGVHISTVSRALNIETRDMVSEPVVEKVLAVARKLGYLRNPLASGLRTRRSQTVGVVIPDLTNPVFPPIIRGIERTLAAAGYVAVLADTGGDERNIQTIVDRLVGRQVDGLILATANRKDPVVDKCIEDHIPFVLVNRTVDKGRAAAVVNDDDFGIRLVLEHLLSLGHRRIAFVGGPLNTSTGHRRHRAFLAVAKQHGLDTTRRGLVVNAKSFSEAEGKSCLSRMIRESRGEFTALVAANDLLALGCFDALAEHGMRCPDDMSVTGFNHMPFVDRLSPPLTTVHIPHDDLGVQSAQLLLGMFNHPNSPPKVICLKPSLVIGGSTRAWSAEASTRRSDINSKSRVLSRESSDP
jgi:LacI family transcriptional regulator, galactose operon repressor